jgi:hypothetical protein
MNHTVTWDPPAERDLTSMWLASRMRHAIKDAADRIDAMLAQSPRDCGESREGNARVMLVWPLGVNFEIDEPNRRVRVTAVWSF